MGKAEHGLIDIGVKLEAGRCMVMWNFQNCGDIESFQEFDSGGNMSWCTMVCKQSGCDAPEEKR